MPLAVYMPETNLFFLPMIPISLIRPGFAERPRQLESSPATHRRIKHNPPWKFLRRQYISPLARLLPHNGRRSKSVDHILRDVWRFWRQIFSLAWKKVSFVLLTFYF